jgi:hypothetical protein
MRESKKTDWVEWAGIAAIWYVPVGLILLVCHKDPEISTLGWFGIYLASPVIVVGGLGIACALALAVCIPVIWIWRRFNLSAHWNRYEDFLNQIQRKSENAARQGNKSEARKLKVVYWLVAIPMVIVIYLIASSVAGRYE